MHIEKNFFITTYFFSVSRKSLKLENHFDVDKEKFRSQFREAEFNIVEYIQKSHKKQEINKQHWRLGE